MDEVRAEADYPAAYDRAHNRHNRGPIDAPRPLPPPPAIQRLMDEVRAGDATPHGLFDRAHNRHNRS